MEIINTFLKAFKPKPKQTISEWADEYRVLSKESSSEAGRWRTSRAEYQRGIMDAVSDAKNHTIVVMSSAQVGKTSILENIIGFYVHYEPAPIMVLQPTLEMAQAFSKDRLEPMFRDTQVLNHLYSGKKKSNNTILHKKFNGGHITMAGANSPASLASRPIKVLLADEVDRYPESAGDEGDPVNLAKKRTTTFWDKKIFLCSTPTIKDASRIEFAYEESDKRRFYVPCPECGEYQVLRWENVKWEENKPDSVLYFCEKCGCGLNDGQRWSAISKGKWIAENPKVKAIAGFHLSELYSPWVKLEEMVRNFLEAKKTPQTLKTFINTSLGETWEDESEKLEYNELLKRREEYEKRVPDGVLILTAGVDTQDDRLEIEIVGWGRDYESWSIDYFIIEGDPANNKTWEKLDEIIENDFDGKKIKSVCVDTGGHKTKFVYRYVSTKRFKNIFAIKGSSVINSPTVNPRPNRNNEYNVPLFMLGVNTIKDTIYSFLSVEDIAGGYCHFPINQKYDIEYFKQLTAEKRESSGKWIKMRNRNEALDCRVYAYAALEILGISSGGINWDVLEKINRPKKRKPQTKDKGIEDEF